MSKFHRYSSIENSYRTKTINLIKEMGLETEEFCIQCKAHGANMGVYCIDGKISYAKRSGTIKESENFYSYECMVERELDKFRAVFDEIGDGIIFGELCGGSYPHPDVEKYNETTVQKGIYYSPKTEFYAFDIYIDNFMNLDEAAKLFLKYDFLYAKTMFRGTLDECLQYPNEFQDPISQWLNLPQIEQNYCEGVVIKPLNPLYFGNGSRIILKNKNEKFAEKKQGQPKVTIDTSLTEESQEKYSALAEYITENRLRNVLSKMGQITQKDFGKITGFFTKDVLIDAEKDDIILNGIGEQQKKFLKKRINSDCGTLLRENFINILDGEF